MKKKNLITTVASVAMVGVIAVGSTLAYLSANDTELTNTFKFANNITVDLYEYTPAGSEMEQSGYDYKNLVAGEVLKKDVDVKLTTDVDSYLFVKVEQGSTGDYALTLGAVDSGWTKLTNLDGDGYAVYGRKVAKDADADAFNLFDTVTVPSVDLSGETTATLKDIVIDVYAVQANLDTTVTDVSSAYTFLTKGGNDIFKD